MSPPVTLAADLARAFAPVQLALACGITPDAWQAELLKERPKRALLNCSRQSGKTTTALLIALWTALYNAPALSLIVSPSQRQSQEAFRSFMSMFHALDNAPKLNAESLTRCEVANGSRVVALPGSERTVRGFAGAKLIVLDEASRIEDALIQALTPMLAVTDGSLIALSTPAGRSGWFAETWHDTGQDWRRVLVPASMVPRFTQEFLDGELRSLGPIRFSEEYGCQFNDDELAMFSSEMIERAFTDEVRAIWL